MTSILDRQTHPDLEVWRKLLRRSLEAIEDVRQHTLKPEDQDELAPWEKEERRPNSPSFDIRLGGGTVLSALWGHRYSQDVDLFTRDTQLITYLTPRLNDRITGLLGTTDYKETGNAVKFIYGPGQGSIDVVAAADVLPDAKPTVEQWEGFTVEIDDPAEIIAKKLYHRGDRATVRDYVDLVEGARQMPHLIERLTKPLASTIQRTMAVARETSEARIQEGLSRTRFIKPAPDPAMLQSQAIKVMQQIASTSGGGGNGRAAYEAWQAGQGW